MPQPIVLKSEEEKQQYLEIKAVDSPFVYPDRFFMLLSANGNIDHGQDPYSTFAPVMGYAAFTLAECGAAVVLYTEAYNLGAGNYMPVSVIHPKLGPIASVSYNGRVTLTHTDYELGETTLGYDVDDISLLLTQFEFNHESKISK